MVNKRLNSIHLSWSNSPLKVGGNILFCLLILFFSNCKKVETPPTSIGTPIFNLQAELNETALNLEAGNNDYFLFTDYDQDENDVHTFIATFAKIDCLDECQDTFRVKIRDFQAVNSNQVDIQTALSQPEYLYKNNEPNFSIIADTTFTFSLNLDASNSISNGFLTNYVWELDTVVVVSTPALFLTYNDILEIPSTVRLDVEAMQPPCSSFATASIAPTGNSTVNSCSVYISENTGILTAMTNGQSPFTYSWSTAETTPEISTNLLVGTYSVTVIDADFCESQASITLGGNPAMPINCRASIDIDLSEETTIDTQIIPNSDSTNFSKIIIEYVDSDGIFYSSESALQDSTAFFNILSFEDFDNDQNDNPTQKLDIELECTLFNENGNLPIQLTNGLGTIAVAHPN